ncbi:hypothetical protein M885DRAFT_501618 [Pelagophyceae sp. CCMP2097]|nr:hypothetical protein M885DRAFT_501618 [Pelagophyceae sp. CCMP2097]
MIAATLYQIPLQDRDPHADAKVDAAVPSFPVVPKAVGANAGKAPKLAAAKAAGKPPATAKAAEETLAVADRRRMPAAAKAPAAAAAKAPAEAPAKAPTAPAAQAHKKPVAAAKAADKTPRNGVAAKDVQHEFSEEFLVGTGKKLLESSPELMTQGKFRVSPQRTIPWQTKPSREALPRQDSAPSRRCLRPSPPKWACRRRMRWKSRSRSRTPSAA